MAKDQTGCRYLQKKLAENPLVHAETIIASIHRHLASLMMDTFGNYLYQRLFELSTLEQQDYILELIKPHFVSVAKSTHGTRACQKTLEYAKVPYQLETIVSWLDGYVLDLCQDVNGNHVLQKLLLFGSQQKAHCQAIYNELALQCVTIGRHRHGCCVLQHALDYGTEESKIQIAEKVVDHLEAFIQDPFGNYVVQYVVDAKMEPFTRLVIYQILGRVVSFSMHKFSSNVVEKVCLIV